jgi:hypothetical protein
MFYLFLLVFSIRLQESLLGEVNRVRVVDNQRSCGVTVAGVQISLGSKPRSWTSSLHQSTLSYLSKDRVLSTSSGIKDLVACYVYLCFSL